MNDLLRTILFLPRQASTIAEAIDKLHYFVIIMTMGGALLVTLIGGWFLFRYRRTAVQKDPSRRMLGTTPAIWLEAVVVLGLFGMFIMWWVIGFWQFMAIRVPPENALEIYVTGKQWMWKFAYPQGANSISTLYVPAGRPVKLILTSRDVIHSFFVPDFRLKEDVVPGRLTTLWFEVKEPGRHDIFCTEYCGVSHSTMRGEIIALSPEEYERWQQGKSPGPAVAGPLDLRPSVVTEYEPPEPVNMVRQGERAAAEQGCLRCHTLDGTPHLGPTWAGLYGSTVPLEDGSRVKVDEAYITESMMDPLARIHAGYQRIMPSYLGLIRPADTSAIIELMKSLRDVRPKPGAQAPWGTVTIPETREGGQ
ncbi:cytochrome c oxidase subunit II [Polyangium sp. y55x31]|uniref:cytochrome c oxidase subunit II n=1 Tax=Polyangium sp. y55x31 TaxID=3042688 RepID=UPI0024821A3D|nr:cytochrome c oxidase subunit II [Polyangium sp. y55x31]MDI1480963.1 cytochrome c oxidase subunit II [Polyangium sp. y55x31]